MTTVLKKYIIDDSRLARGFLSGLYLAGGGAVRTLCGEESRFLFLSALDSGQEDCAWGRFVFSADLPRDIALTVYAFAANESQITADGRTMTVDSFLRDEARPAALKKKLFMDAGAVRAAGASDILLYEQRGRYLWAAVELTGGGDAELRDFRCYLPGDTFFRTFPEVYRADGEFFHRYLSVFSSLYNDLQETIDKLPGLLDISAAPPGLLPVFAGWLGLEMDGLTEPQQRRLLREAYRLSSVKGTRGAIEGALRVLIDEPFYIAERRAYGAADQDSFSVLVCRRADERLHAQIKFLINQFKPLRCRAHVVFLGGDSGMDGDCYLDINASAARMKPGGLDCGDALNGFAFIKE